MKDHLDRKHALVPISFERGELITFESGLTPAQLGQLEKSTNFYLRQHGLPINYSNFTRVIPVIKSLVEDGLKERTEGTRVRITPADNLQKAFQAGYKTRRSLVDRLAEELGDRSDHLTYDRFALPAKLVTGFEKELQGLAMQKDIPGIKQALAEIDKRKPYFQQLLQFALGEVEKVIPGSSSAVKLNSNQEAGLVRNLIFGWVSLGRANPLFETEDLIGNSGKYINNLDQDGKQIIDKLIHTIGLDTDAIEYLTQFSGQIKALITNLTTKDPSSLNDINNAYRSLSPLFLIVNPFYKLADYSDDPREIGKSIWDDGRSMVVNIRGIDYRVPTPAALKIISFKYGDDFKRKGIVLDGIAAITRLKDGVKPDPIQGEISLELENKRVEAEKMRQSFVTFVPSRFQMSRNQVEELVGRQVEMIDEEQEMFSIIKSYRHDYLARALFFLRKYQNSQETDIDASDKTPIVQMYFAAGPAITVARYFLRERLVNRFRDVEELYATTTILGFTGLISDYRSRKNFWDTAVSTTVPDILSSRQKGWIEGLQPPREQVRKLDKEGRIATLRVLIDDVQSKINREIKQRNPALYAQIKEEGLQQHVQREAKKLIYGANDPLYQNILLRDRLTQQIISGDDSSLESMTGEFIRRWFKEREKAANDALASWQSSTAVNRELISPVEPFKKTTVTVEKLNNLRFAKDAVKISLRAIASFAPEELWSPVPVTFKEVTHWELPNAPEDLIWGKRGKRDLDHDVIIRLRSNLRAFLALEGFEGRNADFNRLVSAATIATMKDNIFILSQLLSTEKETKGWLLNLRQRLPEQVQNSGQSYLKAAPADIMRRTNTEIEELEKRLAAREGAQSRLIQSRMRQLEGLGFIMPESRYQELVK